MISFQEAYNVLAQLGSPEEIAELFQQEDIRGYRGYPDSCPTTVWMRKKTGLDIRTNYSTVRSIEGDTGPVIDEESLTSPMYRFVILFDTGHYPGLIL